MSTRNFDAALAHEPGLPSAVKGKEAAAHQKAIMDDPGKKEF
jgi:hypothetical protein